MLMLFGATAGATTGTAPPRDKVNRTKTTGSIRTASLQPKPRTVLTPRAVLTPITIPRTTVPGGVGPATTSAGPSVASTTAPTSTAPPTTTTSAPRPTGIAQPDGAQSLSQGVFVTVPKGWTLRRDDDQRVTVTRGLTSVYYQVLDRDPGEDPSAVAESYAKALREYEDTVAVTTAVNAKSQPGPVANVVYIFNYSAIRSGTFESGRVVLWIRADGLVLTTETSWILGTGSAPDAPPELFDSAVNSWVNAPLLDEPVLPDEPLTIALQGSVDRVSLGDGLWIAVTPGWTSDVSDDRVILKRTSAVVVASIVRSASSIDDAASTYAAHIRDLYASLTLDPPKAFTGRVRMEYQGKYDTSRNAAAISGGFDVFNDQDTPTSCST